MLKRFLSYYKPHKSLFILDMSVAFISALVGIVFPYLTRSLLKDYIPNRNTQMIYYVLGIMVAIILVKTISNYIRMRWGHILGVRMEYDMRADFFRHIQKLSFNYFDNVKTGHIMSRISNDLNRIAEVAHHAPEDFVISVFLIIGSFTFMFIFNLKLALVALIPLPIMLWWGLTYGHKMREGFRQVRKKIADINSTVENSVQGIREVKSYANEDLELEKFKGVNFTFRSAKERMYGIMAMFYSGMNFLSDFYYLSIVGMGSWLMFRGEIGFPDLVAFLLYINFILDPIKRLINFAEQFQQGAASFERFTEIMDIDPDIKDKKDAYTFEPVSGDIRIENLWFKYTTSNDWVLKDVSLEIPAGKNVAIVGESGAGKSTIVSLIPRFYETQKGNIRIDGRDIMDLKRRFLRENIGIVQQNVFLFDGTIRDNIAYGDPNATEAELIEAAQKAYIYDFIKRLPDGFDTFVGERGVKLSGGQKQRISIARVFLKNPAILIFDEATSSLDTESEAYIQQALEELSKDRTMIIIAHRLSTVKNADMIFVLKDGNIIETGDHDSLIDKGDYYYELYSKNLL